MGVLSNAIRMGASQPADSAYEIEKSLRLNRPDTATLSKTPSTNGNRRIWTISYWWKQGKVATVSTHSTNHHTVSDNYDIIGLMNTSEMGMFHAANGIGAKGVHKLRDVEAWYHLVYVLETTHPIAKERCRMYCNGKLQDTVTPGWGSDRYPNLDEEMSWNRNAASYIGVYPATPSYEDCLIADFHFIDGMALGPAAFGEFNSNGVWTPKAFAPPAPNTNKTWSGMMTSETGSFYSSSNVNLFNGILGQGAAGQTASASSEDKWIKFTPSGGLAFKQGIRVQQWPGGNSPYLQAKYTLKLTDGRIFELHVASSNSSNGFFTLYEGSGTIEYIQNVTSNNQYNNWGALEVDGVQLLDGWTDPKERNNLNNDTTWSSMLSIDSGSITNAGQAFNGNLTGNWCNSSGNGGIITFTPSGTISYQHGVRVWLRTTDHQFRINGGSWVASTKAGVGGWNTVATGSGTLTTLDVQYTANSLTAINAIEIDGHVLLDDCDDNSSHLKFNDASSTSALGTDSFSNGNWTANNLSVTAGVGNDSLTDSPTNYGEDNGVGGEVRGNFATWNPFINGTTLTNGNLDSTSGTQKRVTSGFALTSGKWYWEYTLTSGTIQQFGIGSLATANITGSPPGDSPHNSYIILTNGSYYHNGTAAGSGLPSIGNGDVVGVAFDADSRKIWFSKNGTWMASGDPANGNSPLWTVSASYAPYAPTAGAGGADAVNCALNTGQRPFADTAPSGFKCLCTANLPDPAIEDPSTVFDIQLYRGTGADHAISSFKFAPDFVWVKRRDGTNGQNLFDQVRGVTKYLSSSSTNGEGTDANELKSFDSDGFTYGSNAGGNADGGNYVAWCWDAGTSAGSAKSGATGQTITASNSWYNATSGFEILKWSGTGSAGKIGHNLAAPPEFIVVKQTTAHGTSGQGDGNWIVGHTAGLGAGNGRLIFNGTHNWDSGNDSAAHWNDVTPTNELFGLGTSGNVNGSGATYIGYIWRSVEGYSKAGIWDGNSSADGPYIHCGFRPKYILWKPKAAASDWVCYDDGRSPNNALNLYLLTNNNNAEGNVVGLDFLSNGFKLRTNTTHNNTSGTQVIFMAFAETPFKYSRAR